MGKKMKKLDQYNNYKMNYSIDVIYECGAYSLMAKTKEGISSRINLVQLMAEQDKCSHLLLKISTTETKNRYNEIIKYAGNCTFGN